MKKKNFLYLIMVHLLIVCSLRADESAPAAEVNTGSTVEHYFAEFNNDEAWAVKEKTTTQASLYFQQVTEIKSGAAILQYSFLPNQQNKGEIEIVYQNFTYIINFFH